MNIKVHPNSVYESLTQYGVALFPPLYEEQCIQQWNKKLDGFLDSNTAKKRNYVRADQLQELGILDSILNKNLHELIDNLMNDAVLYHCHVYEIEGEQTKSHIHGDNSFKGWHRDAECLYAIEKDKLHHFSLFVYLSDVGIDNAPFEISSLSAFEVLDRDIPSIKIKGCCGTCFLFDRTFLHRATPNKSSQRRRVLKLSFQNKGLFNKKIHLPEFVKTKQRLVNPSTDVLRWFGEESAEVSYAD